MTEPPLPSPELTKSLSILIERHLYRIEDVMELLSVSRTTVYRAVKEGRLKKVTILGGPRITAESVRKLMEKAA